jgi:hypothetical protein
MMNAMSDDGPKATQMHIINPGSTAPDGDFTFELQPRYNVARTVKFALIPSDAESLYRKLGEYIKQQTHG